MMSLSPDELLRLPRPFFFPESPEGVDPELVRRGLCPPLPLVVSPTQGGRERRLLVWGGALAAAARGLGAPALQVREWEEADLPPREALLLCLRLENRRDRYSPRETETLAAVMEEMGIPESDPQVGDLVSSRGALRPAFRRLRLGPAPRELASEEMIDIRTAENLGEVPEEVLRRLRPALEGMSFSDRRIFLNSLVEILLRDGPGNSERLAAELAAAADPVAAVRELRFPQLSLMEERFRDLSRRFFSGSGVVLKHPPYFEGRRFSISFDFDGPQVLGKKIGVLERFLREGGELYDLV